MCKANTPDTSAQQAEAARQSQVQEQRYQEQLAAQQAEWERQRADAERRYQEQKAATDAQNKANADFQAAQVKAQEDAAARSRAYANERDTAIQGAMAGVNDAYAGFNDGYFQDFANKFTAANRVGADQDFERTTRKVRFKLADNRNLNSSAAPDVFKEVSQDHDNAINKIAAEGSNQAAQYRNSINQQKANALTSIGQLAAMPTPDFQTDADATTAAQRFAASLSGLTNSVRSTAAGAHV